MEKKELTEGQWLELIDAISFSLARSETIYKDLAFLVLREFIAATRYCRLECVYDLGLLETISHKGKVLFKFDHKGTHVGRDWVKTFCGSYFEEIDTEDFIKL